MPSRKLRPTQADFARHDPFSTRNNEVFWHNFRLLRQRAREGGPHILDGLREIGFYPLHLLVLEAEREAYDREQAGK